VTEHDAVDCIVRLALSEDLCADLPACFSALMRSRKAPFTDVTTAPLFSDEIGDARVFAKSSGVLSGSVPFRRVFETLDPAVSVRFRIEDGDRYGRGDTVATLSGSVGSILMGERTALNFLGHLSGIASYVDEIVRMLRGSSLRILDTRKTMPGMRRLEKAAVRHGGGTNHRMGLYDMVLIKDNHIDRAGSLPEAVKKVRAAHGSKYRIEVETRNIGEVRQALEAGVDRIMLDNMRKHDIKRALEIVSGGVEVEVSGNLDRRRIRRLRGLSLDFVSAGSITYAAPHADFSLLL